MYYGLYGKLVAKPGARDAVAAILTRGVDELTAYGCMLYIVSFDSEHPDVIWVTEVWKSAEGHTASLESPSVKKAIAEAMPMLTGEFSQTTLSVVGGLGLPEKR